MATDNLFLSGAHSSSQFIFHTVSGCSGDGRTGVTGPTCAAGSPTMIYNVLSSIRLFFSTCSLRSLDECVLCVDNDGIARMASYAFQPICFFVDELGLSSTPFILSNIEIKEEKKETLRTCTVEVSLVLCRIGEWMNEWHVLGNWFVTQINETFCWVIRTLI